MALQGTLDTFALPDVLRLLAATNKTGRVDVTGPRGTGSVWVDAGQVARIEVPDAPHAAEVVDALFELLRFDQGSFTFDADALVDDAVSSTPSSVHDVEQLLNEAEGLLAEWREIELVVPSLDAYVRLHRDLVTPKVTIERSHWSTVVAVGGGSTVRRMSNELCLSELPVSRAVRDLVELGLASVDPHSPDATSEAIGSVETAAHAVPDGELGADAGPTHLSSTSNDEALPAALPFRARRSARVADLAPETSDPEPFVPLELPGRGLASTYEPDTLETADVPAESEADLTAMFPGLAAEAPPLKDEDDVARQLATLSPRAAEAIRAAAAATTEEERDAALAVAEDGEGGPINRGLLLKFLSSVKN